MIDLILRHKACAPYIAGKLFRFLAYDDAVTALPSDLREEAKSVTAAFYKELNP